MIKWLNTMSRIFPLFFLFFLLFTSCATTPEQKAEEKPQQSAPSHVESKYGILITPKNIEVFEVGNDKETKDFDKLFAEANRLFDENQLEEAKKIGEENEYIDKSLEMIKEIDHIYEEKEKTCRN